jgi:hypothetical protein
MASSRGRQDICARQIPHGRVHREEGRRGTLPNRTGQVRRSLIYSLFRWQSTMFVAFIIATVVTCPILNRGHLVAAGEYERFSFHWPSTSAQLGDRCDQNCCTLFLDVKSSGLNWTAANSHGDNNANIPPIHIRQAQLAVFQDYVQTKNEAPKYPTCTQNNQYKTILKPDIRTLNGN